MRVFREARAHEARSTAMTDRVQAKGDCGFRRRGSLNVLDTSIRKKGNSESGDGQDIAVAANPFAKCSLRLHSEAVQNSCATAKSNSNQGGSFRAEALLHFDVQAKRNRLFVAVIDKPQMATKFYSSLDKLRLGHTINEYKARSGVGGESKFLGEVLRKGVVIW